MIWRTSIVVALLILYGLAGPDGQAYWPDFQQQWYFITRYMTEQRSHGWFPTVDADGRPTSRNMIQSMKACDQTVRALLDISEILGVLAGDPLPITTTTPSTRPATMPVTTSTQ